MTVLEAESVCSVWFKVISPCMCFQWKWGQTGARQICPHTASLLSLGQKQSWHMHFLEGGAAQSFRHKGVARKMPEVLVTELSWIMPCVPSQSSVSRLSFALMQNNHFHRKFELGVHYEFLYTQANLNKFGRAPAGENSSVLSAIHLMQKRAFA